MISLLKSTLEKRQLSGWQIQETRKKSFQSFLAKEDRECARTVETMMYDVSIHQKRGDVLGLSNFRIGPGEEGALDARLDEAVFSAGLVSNPPFELPTHLAQLPIVDMLDASIGEKSLADCEARLLAGVHREKNTRLSAAEFFIDRSFVRLLNHKGLDVEQEGTVLHTEFILLSKSGAKENEFISRYSRRFMADFELEKEVAQSAQFARDATVASLPKTGEFPVVLSGEPLEHLFNPLVAKASARLKYNKMIQTELNTSVLADGNVRGDSITLWSNGCLRGAMGSSRFDSYGTPSSRICLIDKNILKTYLADKRYADYLSVPVTGSLGNVEVSGGARSMTSLLDPISAGAERIYHLQAFSAFEPNAITGAFSAEIRAGYEISAAGVRPIKGGSVSGVLQEALLDCHFSTEMSQLERVLAPTGVFFKNLTIAGD